MKIKTFNRTNLKIVREKLNTTLGKLEKDLGIKFEVGILTFEEKTFRTKLTAVAVGDTTKKGSEKQLFVSMFKRKFPYLNANKYWNKSFVANGKKYTITGFSPSRTKKCFVLTRADNGKSGYICSLEQVDRLLK